MTKHPCSTEACKTQSCQCTEGCVSSKPVRPIVYWAVGEYHPQIQRFMKNNEVY